MYFLNIFNIFEDNMKAPLTPEDPTPPAGRSSACRRTSHPSDGPGVKSVSSSHERGAEI